MKQTDIAVVLCCAFSMVGGCEPAEGVDVQQLPSEQRPSPEARAGLPEVSGLWRFAGWELAPEDSASLQAALPSLGQIDIQTQRLDSIAGSYLAGGGRVPVVGEVRRDGIVSVVAPGANAFVAGQVEEDTLWVELTSLIPAEAWPDGARAAFVRGTAGPQFARLEGALPPLALTDSLVQDSAAAPVMEIPRPAEREGDIAAEPDLAPTPAPVVAPAPDSQPQLPPPPIDIPKPDLPDLLGTPVVRDTTSSGGP
ncbi:MAG TPA: hypothetical protein VFI91_07070 [Longimicrobiaceae bacterium]|nr:hypothetical protein [Longimicrobiaceae bacterium]